MSRGKLLHICYRLVINMLVAVLAYVIFRLLFDSVESIFILIAVIFLVYTSFILKLFKRSKGVLDICLRLEFTVRLYKNAYKASLDDNTITSMIRFCNTKELLKECDRLIYFSIFVLISTIVSFLIIVLFF